MPRLVLHRLSMAHPGDVSALAGLLGSGALDARDVRAVIGKTEGNGGLNDFTRGFFAQSLLLLLSRCTGEAMEALAGRIPCVLSGGTEGVLSPHYVVFAVQAAPDAVGEGLALGTAFGPVVAPGDVGNDAQIARVAAATRAAMRDAGIDDPARVALVQVKSPAGGPGLLLRSVAGGAMGAALALGDVPAGAARGAALLEDLSLWSGRVSASAGVEVTRDEVVVLGRAPGWSGGWRMAVRPMADALDLAAVQDAFRGAGLDAVPDVPEEQRGRIAAVLAKAEPDRRGTVRGQRHTMLGDTDIDAQRHLRCAAGAVIAAVAGDGRVFVSGGAAHQGPPGGGLVAVIAREAQEG
ncbi:ring-opening amidohydrolase [Roseomonas sp. OT10]|uniref:ring-opening amidohydrolase n=1 Tax=Roseomonas cutis TaxID=2897332 RepID=UPI001E4444BE|nr:ring-opening amidohydrolase [Roseomonas sp. OT10]UFN49716.1 ring-opening amidohydrolase [Roseomonas sp. OT10]